MRRGWPPTPRMCIGKNAQLPRMNVRAKCTLPQDSFIMPAEHLREPEVDRAEDAEDAAREQHVVNVGDDEVGVVDDTCPPASRP